MLSNNMVDIKKIFGVARHPKPEVSTIDTNLRYTDILFGFVIKELAFRLQHIFSLPWAVSSQLVVSTILVLGSWIGFRRSLHRSGYEVKFFNLPLCRFLLDQVMLVCYFRIATLTNADGKPVTPETLLSDTIGLLCIVYLLYLAWDALGIWMGLAETSEGKPRYPKIIGKDMSTIKAEGNTAGLMITAAALVLFCGLWFFLDKLPESVIYLSAIVVLVIYRWAKEIRNSLKE